jgi:PAS domain S-box-containing protein
VKRLAAIAIAAASTLAMAVAYAGDDDRFWWAAASWTLAGVFVVLGVASARRRATGEQRRGWSILLAGSLAWLGGELAYDVYGLIGFPASPNVSDLGWFTFAICTTIGVTKLVPAAPSAQRVAGLERLPLIAATGALVVALFADAATASTLPVPARVSALAYAVLYASVPIVMIQALIGGTISLRRSPALVAVLAGALVEAVAYVLWTPQILAGSYAAGASALDGLWAAGVLLIGAGGFAAQPTVEERGDERRWTGALPIATFAVLIAVLIVFAAVGESLMARLTLQGAIAVVGGLLSLRAIVLGREQRALLAEQRRANEELRSEREKSTRFFDISRDMLCVASPDGSFLHINRAWSDTLGFSADELLERPFVELAHPDDRERTVAQVARVAAGGRAPTAFENRFRTRDGSYRWLSWNSAVGSDGLIYGRAADTTDAHRQRDELARAHADLEVKAVELERSNADLEQFAYVASHDLAEPLRMVSSYVQLLERRYAGQLDEKADKYIHYAVDGANRMRALIDDLLAYSRAGGRGDARTTVDTGEALRASLEALRTALGDRQAVVSVDGDLPAVVGIEAELSQVFQNLIGNALKFCDEKPRIAVSVVRDGASWRFSVADNGIGIDAAHAGRIFTIFQRLHSRERYVGTGIGLSIAKKIVERHGGAIWCEPGAERGTIFHFTLPAMVEEARAA